MDQCPRTGPLPFTRWLALIVLPWTTVAYHDNFKDNLVKFSYFIPTKLLGRDGKTFWLAWSGWPEYDSVSFVKGELMLREPSRAR